MKSDMRFGLIGKKLPHTLSPEIHAAFGREYGVFELADEDAVAEFFRKREFSGVNVTIPYKETVIPLLDEVRGIAAEIGAVNTVVNDDGKLIGYNTDVDGMSYAMKMAGICAKGKTALILGSGGTSKTARFMLEKEGADRVLTVSRKGELNYSNVYERAADSEIIVNTTPVGMMPLAYAEPVDVTEFCGLTGVFDAVYNPLETKLIAKARACGVNAANGLDMLVEQARLAHNIFVESGLGGEIMPETKTEQIVGEIIKRRRNIVLVGMAGTGKSTVGKLLAERLGRKFIDTDVLIEKKEGKDIPSIFKESGEGYFREAEKSVVKDVCSRMGAVIATGGGAPIDEENAFYIKSNGVVVWLRRGIEDIAVCGRPLSTSRERAAELYIAREPVYAKISDFSVDNEKSVVDAVEEILKKL